MRSKIVAGNWKMNLTFGEAEELVDNLLDRFDENELATLEKHYRTTKKSDAF